MKEFISNKVKFRGSRYLEVGDGKGGTSNQSCPLAHVISFRSQYYRNRMQFGIFSKHHSNFHSNPLQINYKLSNNKDNILNTLPSRGCFNSYD